MTPQDFKKIGDLLDKKLDQKLDEKLLGLKTDVSSLKTDVSSLKTDVSSLKTDVAVLKHVVDKNTTEIMKINSNILKWKSEMFDSAEVFMKETRDEREFRIIGGHQLASNTHRIGDLETKVFGSITGA